MRRGPNMEVLASHVNFGARLSVNRGGEVLSVDVPAYNVKVEETLGRAVRGRLSFDVGGLEWVPTSPYSPLNNFGQRVNVHVLMNHRGEVFEVDLGWWIITDWEETDSGVSVVCADLLELIANDDMLWPSSPPPGATLLSEAQRLSGQLPVVLENVDDYPIPRHRQWSVKRLEALDELTLSESLFYRVAADGCIHILPIRNGEPIAAYSVNDLLLEMPRVSEKRKPNNWLVVASPQGKETHWSAQRVNDTAPYEHSAYGRVTDRHTFDVAKNAGAVEIAADTRMKHTLETSELHSLSIVYDPRIELGDIITVHSPDGQTIVGTVDAYSASLTDAEPMRIDVKELSW